MAWEPELGVGPGLTASSASELGGSSLHLLVVRCGAILILLTLFKSIPFDTTREQNALHPRPPFLHWLSAEGHSQPRGSSLPRSPSSFHSQHQQASALSSAASFSAVTSPTLLLLPCLTLRTPVHTNPPWPPRTLFPAQVLTSRLQRRFCPVNRHTYRP